MQTIVVSSSHQSNILQIKSSIALYVLLKLRKAFFFFFPTAQPLITIYRPTAYYAFSSPLIISDAAAPWTAMSSFYVFESYRCVLYGQTYMESLLSCLEGTQVKQISGELPSFGRSSHSRYLTRRKATWNRVSGSEGAERMAVSTSRWSVKPLHNSANNTRTKNTRKYTYSCVHVRVFHMLLGARTVLELVGLFPILCPHRLVALLSSVGIDG